MNTTVSVVFLSCIKPKLNLNLMHYLNKIIFIRVNCTAFISSFSGEIEYKFTIFMFPVFSSHNNDSQISWLLVIYMLSNIKHVTMTNLEYF